MPRDSTNSWVGRDESFWDDIAIGIVVVWKKGAPKGSDTIGKCDLVRKVSLWKWVLSFSLLKLNPGRQLTYCCRRLPCPTIMIMD